MNGAAKPSARGRSMSGPRRRPRNKRSRRHGSQRVDVETFGSERLTGALLDRLTHHVTILEMNGDSYRLAQSRTEKPLPNA